MELTMTNSFGFRELNETEMMMVDGGWSFGKWLTGFAAATFGAVGAVLGAMALQPEFTAIGIITFIGGISMMQN